MAKKYGFARCEKLKSVVCIDKLFASGCSFWTYPFSVYYRVYNEEGGAACRMLVSVGKHYFKHAVDRNRLKRLVREAYRLNKESLVAIVNNAAVHLDFALVYKSKEIADYKTVEAGVRQALSRIKESLEKSPSNSSMA